MMKTVASALRNCGVMGVVAFAVCSSAVAEVVTLQISDSAGNGPYAGKQDKKGNYYWSDMEAPHAGADYLIPPGMKMGVSAAEGPIAFAGDSLTISDTMWFLGGWGAVYQAGKPVTITGGGRFYASSYHFTASAQPFVSEGTAASPARFYLSNCSSGENKDYYFPSRFRSEEGSVMEFAAGTSDAMVDAARVRLQGSDFSEFKGAVRFAFGAGAYSTEPLSIPGTLEIGTNSILSLTKTSGESSFGTLVFRSGARLVLAANNRHLIKVTQKLEIEEGVSFNLQKFTDFSTGTPPDIPVFELTAEAVAASGDLQALLDKATISRSPAATLPNISWTFAAAADGGTVVGITYREIVKMAAAMGYGNDAFRLDKGEAVSAHWTDARYPHGQVDYYLYGFNALAYYSGGPARYVFPGETLVVNAPFGLYPNIKDFEANFVFLGANRFRAMGGGTEYHLRGKMHISPYTKTSQGETYLGEASAAYNFNIGEKSSLTLDADISGEGVLAFGMSWEEKKAVDRTVGTVALTGDNSKFVGKMSVSCWQADTIPADWASLFGDQPFVPGPFSNITLRVAGPTSLGGVRAAFADDALAIGNECRLAFTETAVFAEPTRGWYFPQKAYVRVPEDCVVTVRQVMKFGAGANVVKEGAGTLMLGATPTADAGARPSLRIAEGALGFISTTALAGVDASFDEGTELVVDVLAKDPDMMAKGLVVGDSAVTLPTTLPIVFMADGMTREASASVGVMTFATKSAAEAFAAKLAFGRVAHHRVVKSVQENGDGTFTVRADVLPSGFSVILR